MSVSMKWGRFWMVFFSLDEPMSVDEIKSIKLLTLLLRLWLFTWYCVMNGMVNSAMPSSTSLSLGFEQVLAHSHTTHRACEHAHQMGWCASVTVCDIHFQPHHHLFTISPFGNFRHRRWLWKKERMCLECLITNCIISFSVFSLLTLV